METQYTLQVLASGGYFIIGLFATYAAIAIYRPQSIARMWAFKLGLVLFGLGLSVPLITSLLMVSMQLNSYSTRPGPSPMTFQVMLPICGLFFTTSVVATMGSLLPRVVFIAPKDDRPPRNPFE